MNGRKRTKYEFKPGDRVTYRPIPSEFGTVTSMNDKFVFVLFDDQPIYARGKACCPHDLMKTTINERQKAD
jgi:hypothetical protein